MNQRNILLAALAGLAIGVVFAACGQNTNPCNTTNCASGCCSENGICETGNTVFACGLGGNACIGCTATQICQAQVCVDIVGSTDGGNQGHDAGMDGGTDAGMMPMDAGMDAGMKMDGGVDAGMTGTGAIGAGCTTNEECASGVCADEATTSGFLPGGYCTADCSSAACPAGSDCSEFIFQNLAICVADCPNPGAGRDTCRTGYVCERFLVASDTQGSCFPACTSTNDCPSGASGTPLACEQGYCCGEALYKCCAGGVCKDGTTCTDGYCQQQ